MTNLCNPPTGRVWPLSAWLPALGLACCLCLLPVEPVQAQTVQRSSLYYRIGGGAAGRANNKNQLALKLGLNVALRLNYSCGKFDIGLSWQTLMNGFANLGETIEKAVQAGVAALPMYVLQRAQPGLYQLIQHFSQKADALIAASLKTCEQMEAAIKAGQNPYEDWVKLAKGDLWTVKASASGDLVQAKLDIEKNEQAQKIGVNWVFKQRAGGVNQAPLRPVRDLSLAGYRTTLNKTTTDTASPSSADKSTRMCKAFPTEDELVKFATEVLGDRQVFTCEQGKDGCPPQSQEDTTAATGLGPKYEAEYNLVAPKLKELANTAPGANVSDAYGQLQGISAPGLTVSQQLLDALRAMPPETRAIAVDRLAQELSMHRVIDKALVTRAVLLTAMSLPEVAHAGEAMKETQQKIDRLTHYIDDLVYESRIRKELTSNTALAIMGAQSQQDSQSVLVPESKSADPNPIEGGRVKTSP